MDALHDPVCGIRLEKGEETAERTVEGHVHILCSEKCAKRFDVNPARYHGEPIIKLRGVKKSFGEGEGATHVLHGVDLNIWEGDFVALVGASGSGKSTVLNLIGNLDVPTCGTIIIGGRNVSTLTDEERAHLRSQTFGFIFQQYNLIPWLSAIENALVPIIFAGKGRHTFEPQIRERFSSIDMAHRLTHRPNQLSGGEQQRVALVRALANNPSIVLGDEPTGNLDSKTGEKILSMLKELHKKEKKTLVVVTHDASIAAQADHVIVLKDGRIIRSHLASSGVYTH